MERRYTDASRQAIDNIKYLSRSIYGALPFGCNPRTITITLTYDNPNSLSDLHILENPFFVTNVQITREIDAVSEDVYISASADNADDNSVMNVGQKGELKIGSIWRYIKIGGGKSDGSTIELKITGYELDYQVNLELETSSPEYGSVVGGGSYFLGYAVSITAVATNIGKFVSWSDGNTEVTRTIVVSSNMKLTAIFEKK